MTVLMGPAPLPCFGARRFGAIVDVSGVGWIGATVCIVPVDGCVSAMLWGALGGGGGTVSSFAGSGRAGGCSWGGNRHILFALDCFGGLLVWVCSSGSRHVAPADWLVVGLGHPAIQLLSVLRCGRRAYEQSRSIYPLQVVCVQAGPASEAMPWQHDMVGFAWVQPDKGVQGSVVVVSFRGVSLFQSSSVSWRALPVVPSAMLSHSYQMPPEATQAL